MSQVFDDENKARAYYLAIGEETETSSNHILDLFP